MDVTKLKTTAFILILAMLLITVTPSCYCTIDQQDIEIELAPIHDVQVSIAESYPEQVFIYIKGGLADSCTTFHDIETQRNGHTIDITVTTERPKDAVCAQVYSYFEKNVALGSDFTSGETYTVNVNDVTTSFEYP
jgi:inhibitor of cysteine peptidase